MFEQTQTNHIDLTKGNNIPKALMSAGFQVEQVAILGKACCSFSDLTFDCQLSHGAISGGAVEIVPGDLM